MNAEFSDSELAQMHRADELQRLAWRTLWRYFPVWILVFAAIFAAAWYALTDRSERSPVRYSAETKLLYAPRQNSKLPPLGDKQIFGVLDRASLRRAVAARLALPPDEAARLPLDIEFQQSPRPSNLFVVTARAPSGSNAVAKANAFAAVLVDEYVAYRKHDIEAWADDLRRQKEDYEAQLAEMAADGATASDGAAALAAEAAAFLRNLADGKRRELVRLSSEIAAETLRVTELEKRVDEHADAIVRHAPRLSALRAEIAALDADLAKLREKYTDHNPRVAGKLEDRAALVAESDELLAQTGLASGDPATVEHAAAAARALADAVVRRDALLARREALEQETAANDAMEAAAPEASGAALSSVRRNELEKAVLALEERINDARFFSATIAADLRQIEPASDFGERRPGGRRDLALAGLAAAVATAVLFILCVAAADARSRRRAAAATAALALAAFLAGGCASNRWNERAFDKLEELGTVDAVVTETKRDAEAERTRLEVLARLDDGEEPVYRISPGDKIQIRVYGEQEMDITTRIGPDGTIGMMFVGQTTISGLTIAEARDEIESKLAQYIKHPVVGLAVLEVASETVTVGGSAARPGLYQISNETRLADAYAMAGGSAARLFNGIVVDVADLENSLLVRNGQRIPVDFQRAIEQGDPTENIRVRKGDYIFIAQRMESSVTICGDVRHPHKRLYEAGMGLLEALSTAGWMSDVHWRYVLVIRDSLGDDPKMYKVDVDGILAGSRRNVRLRPNDIVFVPRDELEGWEIAAHRFLPDEKINIPQEALEPQP